MTATARSRRANGSPDLMRSRLLFALATLALLPALALAKKDDRSQPMNFTAKSTNAYNAPNSITTLTGNVKLTQGTLLITGAEAKVYLDKDTQISRVVVTGSQAHIQQLDENNNLMQGDAAQLDYDNINGIAVLTGNAVVRQQGRGEFHGDKLVYNTQTSLITGEAAGDGLVHGVILPKQKPAGASPAPAKPTSTPPATKPAETAQPAPQVEQVSRQGKEEPQDSPIGDWLTEGKGTVRIAKCGHSLCGYVLTSSNEKGEAILINMKPKKERQWTGSVYSQNSGDTYYGTIGMKGNDTLRVEACALGRFYCSGNNWSRITRRADILVTSWRPAGGRRA